MPRINTKNKADDSNLDELLKELIRQLQENFANKKKDTSKEAEDKAKKEAIKKGKELEKQGENYRKDLERLQKNKEENAYQRRLGLAQNSVNAVMPADRRQFFGASALGSIMGIDPAIVQMLGIDKLGANLWNSKFGWGAIKQRHKDKLEEEKINEKFGINTGKDKEKFGSVVKDDPNASLKSIDKGIKQVVKNTGGDKTGDTQDKKKGGFGGLLEKVLGFGKKLLLPMLVGMIANAFKTHVKNGIANLLGGGDFGNFIGGAIADFLPGAIGGLAYGLKNHAPLIPSALIGGTISFAIPRIRRTIDQIVGAFSGDQDPNAGNLDRYTEKAMTGALIGASIAGWKQGSLKAALLGGGIGVATEFILARVNDAKTMFSGEQVEIKTVAGIPEAALGGLISGAMIGAKFGGWKGALWGALIGGGAGMIWATVQDMRNQIVAAKSGKMAEPKSLFGIPYPIVSGLIGGAAIGYKFGGLWPGLVLGALIGGLAGLIANEVTKYKAKIAGAEANADEAMENNEDFKQIDANNLEDKKVLDDPNATAAEKQAARVRMANTEVAKKKTKEQLAGFAKWDKNGDGKLDEEEQKALENAFGKGSQSMAMQDAMKDLRSKGIEVTKENLMKYNAGKLENLQTATNNVFNLPSNNMSTVTQITENNEEQLDESRKQSNYLEIIANAFQDPENKLGKTEIIQNNSGGGNSSPNAYSTTTAAGVGLKHP